MGEFKIRKETNMKYGRMELTLTENNELVMELGKTVLIFTGYQSNSLMTYLNLYLNPEKEKEAIQREIIIAIHTSDGGATYKNILKSPLLEENEVYKTSFQDLVDRKIIIKNEKGVFEI